MLLAPAIFGMLDLLTLTFDLIHSINVLLVKNANTLLEIYCLILFEQYIF